MARVHYVKAARQRYEMKPVLDKDGSQKRADVSRTTKRGRAVTRRLSEPDLTRPKPNHDCGKCGREIKVGDPYKWIAPKSGPYGGYKRYRCGTCPTWQVWEYSGSLPAQLARVSHEFWEAVDSAESVEDVEQALQDAANEVRDLAEQRRESAQNMEDGFQHATSASDDLKQQAEDLDSWAQDIEQATVPPLPDPEEQDCEFCEDGSPDEGDSQCRECSGTGKVTPEEPTEEQMDAWHDECQNDLTIVDESPV